MHASYCSGKMHVSRWSEERGDGCKRKSQSNVNNNMPPKRRGKGVVAAWVVSAMSRQRVFVLARYELALITGVDDGTLRRFPWTGRDRVGRNTGVGSSK